MKKMLGILAAASLLFALMSCAQTDSNPAATGETEPMADENNEWGIVLTAEDVTPFGMTLVGTQSGGDPPDDLHTGRAFSLERFKNGEWKPQHTLVVSDSRVWTLEALGVPNEGSARWEVSWEFLYGELPPGTYRIKKVFRGYVGMGAFENRPYYAEFTITE